VDVIDAGPGIPETERDRVFDLFYTTRREGTGIGLASVRQLAEANGGRAELASSGPEGSRFRLSFPADAGAGPQGTGQ
jgi:signal transduction histidine kinase